MVARYMFTALVAGGVTFGLFFVMQYLISQQWKKEDPIGGRVIEFVRLKKESEVETRKRKMPEKMDNEEPPPPPDINLSSARPGQDVEGVAFNFDAGLDLGGPNLGVGTGDSDTVPLVRVPPQYPIRAAQRGIEGWVTIEFTISKNGTVKNPVVVDSSSAMFHRSALRAIRKWKYNPKIEDGVAVERPGVRVRLTFDLEDVG